MLPIRRLALPALFLLATLFVGQQAIAQDVIPAPGASNTPDLDPYLWHVVGLPPGSNLAVRSGAGPSFRTILELTEGTPIDMLECQDNRGGYWCRIATVGRPRVSGWVDGRYLSDEMLPPGYGKP